MTPRLTWLGDRRTIALVLAGMLAVGLFPTLSRGTDWLGSWKAALDAGLFGLTLLGPVAAGIACAAYVRFATSGAEHLVQTARRPWVAWLRPAVAVWGLASLTALAITICTTTAASIAGSVAYPGTAWVVLPALCVLAAQVSVGVLLGGLGRRTWLAPVAAAAVFGLGILGAVGVTPDLFRAGGLGVSYAGETFDATTLVLQAGATLGAVAALLWLSNRPAVGSSLVARSLVVILVVVGVGSYVVLGRGVHDRYRAVADPELVCRGEAPQVCLARETTRPLDDLVAKMERQARALTDLGLELPSRYVQPQVDRDHDETDGGLYLMDEELEATVSDSTAALSLATPADCAAYSADVAPPEVSFDARRLLTRWLLVRAGLLRPDQDDEDRAWLAAGLEEQRSWVVTAYEQLRACDLTSLRLPPGV